MYASAATRDNNCYLANHLQRLGQCIIALTRETLLLWPRALRLDSNNNNIKPVNKS